MASKGKGYFLTGQEFTQRGTTTSKKDGPFLLEESQRLINNDSTIRIENFKSWETRFGSSFITTPSTIMFITDAVVPGVRIVL
jgi:hypothetical protein